ncbi:MAG: hypothetical protein JWP22_3727, partial [Ramlibacter sp.]|jgi:hypothetical protein|nr:hypothetical protein [Ramlibacter sp.]MDB5915052.1 hypothetical protein [Ramlibacter sp.]
MPSHLREALARELYAVHEQIFDGLDFEEFREYVVERPAWRTWIYVKHNPYGYLVGYTAMHAFQVPVQGRPSTVIRMEAGTLPEHRGRDLTMVYGVLRLLRIWLNQPWRRTCLFAALTHPSSYTFLAHYAPVIWPNRTHPAIPDDILQKMDELAGNFQLQRVDPENPLVRQVDWMTVETDEETLRWRRSRRPDTRFYMEANPGYVHGHGLLTYIPVDGLILLRSLTRFLVGRAGRIMRMVLGTDPAPTTGVASEFGALTPMTKPAASGPPAQRRPGVPASAPASRW